MSPGAPGLMSISSTDFAPRNPALPLPPPARANECCRLAPADSEDPRLLSVGRLLSSAEDWSPTEDESSKTWSYYMHENTAGERSIHAKQTSAATGYHQHHIT